MLREALAVISIVALSIVAWPVYAVIALGSRRGMHDYYG
jgi:hypothetical protein